MKLSFTTMATPKLDHRGAIELAKRFGFHGVDIRCSDHLGEAKLSAPTKELRIVEEDFRDAGLTIPGVLCYNSIDEAAQECWQMMYDELERLVHLAEELGARSIRMFGGKLEGVASVAKYMGQSAAVIREVLKVTESDETEPVRIVIQNHVGSYDSLQSVQLAELVDSPRFGIVYSPDHTALMREGEFEAVLKAVRPWTKELYIADLAQEDGKLVSVLPGTGAVPLRDMVGFFRDHGFDGYYTFKWEKIWNDRLPAADVALPHYVAFMHSL